MSICGFDTHVCADWDTHKAVVRAFVQPPRKPRWVPVARADIPDGARVRETKTGVWFIHAGIWIGDEGTVTFEVWTEGTP